MVLSAARQEARLTVDRNYTPGTAKVFDWNDLKYFLELERQRRLGPAAKRLHVDHTTVGRRIAELEKALNIKLFDRTQDGFVLTESGHRLLPHAESMENGALAIAENAGRSATLAGSVRLATMEGIGSFYLAPHLLEFHKQYPAITVELVTSAQLLNLTKREADVSLSFVCPSGSRLIVRKIGRFDLKLYGAPSYLRQHGTPKSAADLENHVFVDYIEDLVQIPAVRWLHDVIPHPQVVFRSSSMMAQQNAAVAGVGLVVLPSFTAAHDARLKPLLFDQISIKRDLWLSVHEDLRHMARVKALTTFLTELIERDQVFLDGHRD
jgi:DNA-binding transcriptional LysR family regulator